MLYRALLLISLVIAWPLPARALEQVSFKRDGQDQHVAGRLLVKAKDGGLLLQSADGVIWSITPEELVEHTTDEQPFVPLTSDELGKQIVKQLPAGFEVYTTKNYVICYNTSKAYAQWCGALFERLYLAFTNYWSKKGFEIKPPEFPLVALVFADKVSYAQHARAELGGAVDSIIGYYSFQTNRMTMFDMTGTEAAPRGSSRTTSASQINAMLARPEAERSVATVIHEATHQIAFNCGLQTRYADIPLWVSEGVAVYFETPDLKNATGWSNIGSVNRVRLAMFQDYMTRRPANSLKTLLGDDTRFRDPKQAGDAYAEAWAFNYFLIRQHPKEYLEYFRLLGKKPRLIWDNPEARFRDFQSAFGTDLAKLDAEFLRYMRQVR